MLLRLSGSRFSGGESSEELLASSWVLVKIAISKSKDIWQLTWCKQEDSAGVPTGDSKKNWEWGGAGETWWTPLQVSSQGYCLGNRQASPFDATTKFSSLPLYILNSRI